MNDSLRSDVFVRYQPESIACACIYLSARLLKIPLPNKPAWFLIFGVPENVIQDICHTILQLYARKKPDPEKLDKVVDELKKAHQEAKMRAKGLSGNTTPTANAHTGFSPADQPGSPKQGQSPVIEVTKEKDDIKNNEISPKNDTNHVNQLKRKRSHSPVDRSPSPHIKKGSKSSSSSDSQSGSHSPSPRRKTKTPPRSYKERKSRSRTRIRIAKEGSKHRSHKKKRSRSHSRSHSHSPHSHSPHRHSAKRAYKDKEREKVRHKSRSRSRERNHHSNSSYEKPHKSRKDRSKDISTHRSRSHSRERSRR